MPSILTHAAVPLAMYYAAGRGKVMVEQRRKRMAKMQQTVRAGRKPKDTIF